tara:strand:- start:280 stop:636 length:357 start_codon:yes stop_codon:yes gene_type:complete
MVVLVATLLVEMVMSRVVPVVVEDKVAVEEVALQFLPHFNPISLVDLMVAKETLNQVVQVETWVVEVVVPPQLLVLLDHLEHLERLVVVMVVMEKRFQQHTYQTLLHRQILDQALVNS